MINISNVGESAFTRCQGVVAVDQSVRLVNPGRVNVEQALGLGDPGRKQLAKAIIGTAPRNLRRVSRIGDGGGGGVVRIVSVFDFELLECQAERAGVIDGLCLIRLLPLPDDERRGEPGKQRHAENQNSEVTGDQAGDGKASAGLGSLRPFDVSQRDVAADDRRDRGEADCWERKDTENQTPNGEWGGARESGSWKDWWRAASRCKD